LRPGLATSDPNAPPRVATVWLKQGPTLVPTEGRTHPISPLGFGWPILGQPSNGRAGAPLTIFGGRFLRPTDRAPATDEREKPQSVVELPLEHSSVSEHRRTGPACPANPAAPQPCRIMRLEPRGKPPAACIGMAVVVSAGAWKRKSQGRTVPCGGEESPYPSVMKSGVSYQQEIASTQKSLSLLTPYST